MRSHQYQFTFRELMRSTLPTLVALLCLGGGLRLSNHLGLLPAPPITTDPNTTVLAHQALASRSPDPAEIVLLGDSTCLVGIDASELSRQLPGRTPVQSLSLFIWMDLVSYGEALTNFAAANPGQVRAVVLLVSPLKLNSESADKSIQEMWHQILYHHKWWGFEPESERWKNLLGARLLRQRVVSHFLATPLSGSEPGLFGFSSDVDTYLTKHRGSLVDLGAPLIVRGLDHPPGLALTPEFKAESLAFRAMVPPNVKLFIGLTPFLKRFSYPEARQKRDDLLCQWNQCIHADGLLTNLPPALPSVFFSASAHLNEAGQKRLTTSLQHELARLLPPRSQSEAPR
jgi:hypothetical protein